MAVSAKERSGQKKEIENNERKWTILGRAARAGLEIPDLRSNRHENEPCRGKGI